MTVNAVHLAPSSSLSFMDMIMVSSITVFLITIIVTIFIEWKNRNNKNGNKSNHIDWSKQTVLITGGSSGIGLALVNALMALSSRVIILDINEPSLSPSTSPFSSSLLSNIPNSDTKLEYYKCDVSDNDQVSRLSHLKPSIIINCAGINNNGLSLLQLDPLQINRIIQVNLLSIFWIIKAFLPWMINMNNGRIVNVSSCLGLGGVSNMTDYCATKFAIYGLSESLRLELQSYSGIKIHVACPFLIREGMFKNILLKYPWLTQPLNNETVANAIIDGIEKDQFEILIPKSLYLLKIIRLFPWKVYEFLHYILETSKSFTTVIPITDAISSNIATFDTTDTNIATATINTNTMSIS